MEKRDKRSTILEAAKRLFAEKGYHSTGVSDIIKQAGIARGTFYIYFKSKKCVFNHLVEDLLGQIQESVRPVVPGDPPDMESVIRQIRINLAHVLRPLFQDKDLARLLVSHAEGLDRETEEKLRQFYGELTQWLTESFQDGQELGIVRPGSPRLMAISALGILRGIIWSWAVGGEDLDLPEVVEELAAIVSEGMLVRPKGETR